MKKLNIFFIAMLSMTIFMTSFAANAKSPSNTHIDKLVKQTQLEKTIAEMQAIVLLSRETYLPEDKKRSFIEDMVQSSEFKATIKQVIREMKDELYRDLKHQFTAEEINELIESFKDPKLRVAYRAFQETYLEYILGIDKVTKSNLQSAQKYFKTYLCKHLGLDENNLSREEERKIDHIKVAFFYGIKMDPKYDVPSDLSAEDFYLSWEKHEKAKPQKPQDYDMLHTILTEVIHHYPPFEWSNTLKLNENTHNDMGLNLTQSSSRDFTTFLNEMMEGYNLRYDDSLRPKQIMNDKLMARAYPDGMEKIELFEKYLQDPYYADRILGNKLDMSTEDLKVVSNKIKKSQALKKFIGFAAGTVDHNRMVVEAVYLISMIHEDNQSRS